MDAGLIVMGLARDLPVPSADPEPFQPHVAADVGQVEARQHVRLGAGDLQVGELLPARREDEDPPLLLVEVGLEMRATRARRDLLHHREVGFLLELALDDQVATPGFEAERPLHGGLLVVNAQGEDEVRLGLPGDLELDAGAVREPEIAADRCALAIGQGLARFLAPVLLAGGLVPAEQAVGTQVDHVRAIPPSVDTMDVRTRDVQAAQPRELDLRVVLIEGDQRPEEHVAGGQLEAELSDRFGLSRRRWRLDPQDMAHGEFERRDERSRLPGARSPACPMAGVPRPRSRRSSGARQIAAKGPATDPRRVRRRPAARRPRAGRAGSREGSESPLMIADDGCTSGSHLSLIGR